MWQKLKEAKEISISKADCPAGNYGCFFLKHF